MAVAILDDMSITSGAFTASRAVSVGTNRIALRALTYGHGSDAAPPTTPPTWGGQAMTLLANVDVAGSDVVLAVYYLLESGIAAMSGSALSTPDGTYDAGHQGDITWTVQGADQAAPAYNSAATTGTGGSLSLARVADSVTAALSVHDVANNYGTSTNPPTTSVEVASQNTTAYGIVADTARNVSYGWANTFNRDDVSIVMNFAPAPTGPAFTAIDNPITDSITGTVDASTTATDYRITAGGVTITQAVDGSPVTGTAFNIATLSRGNLPAIGTSITVELIDGATVRATTTTDLQPEVGQAAIVASANTVASNSIYNPLYCTGTPLDGDQHQWTTTDGVTIDAAGLVTGEGAFSVRHWELATGTWGAWADYTVSDGIIWVRGGMIDVMRENMIRVM